MEWPSDRQRQKNSLSSTFFFLALSAACYPDDVLMPTRANSIRLQLLDFSWRLRLPA
jgi:hypothetical protein